MERATLVAHARLSIARGSKSFAVASKLFDPITRERAWLLYSWCRACDDMADGQDGGGARVEVLDAGARLERMRALTGAALRGEATGEPAFDALGLVAAETAMPRAFIEAHLAGFALDAADWRPDSEDDLLRYCFQVAGAVGLMMAVVMGVDPSDDETLDRACDLGLAFQLANIARDVAEDASVGRCYLPRTWLEAAGVDPARLMADEHRPALATVTARCAAMAEAYEASARVGAARLPFRARWAVLAAAGIYGDIARAVAADPLRALEGRTVTSRAAKAGWVVRALGQGTANRPAAVARDGLWTRPRETSASSDRCAPEGVSA